MRKHFRKIQHFVNNLYEHIRYYVSRVCYYISHAYYKYVRGWNGIPVMPRGVKSKHGYMDVADKMPAVIFSMFMDFYKNDYPHLYKWSESDSGGVVKDSVVKWHIQFQKDVEHIAKWVEEVFDRFEVCEVESVKDYEKIQKEIDKMLALVIKYHRAYWS